MFSYRERARAEFDVLPGAQWRVSDASRLWSRHLEEWRRAAKRVRRTWKAWRAADRASRDAAYREYLTAVAAEEAAARRLERDARFRHRHRLRP